MADKLGELPLVMDHAVSIGDVQKADFIGQFAEGLFCDQDWVKAKFEDVDVGFNDGEHPRSIFWSIKPFVFAVGDRAFDSHRVPDKRHDMRRLPPQRLKEMKAGLGHLRDDPDLVIIRVDEDMIP